MSTANSRELTNEYHSALESSTQEITVEHVHGSDKTETKTEETSPVKNLITEVSSFVKGLTAQIVKKSEEVQQSETCQNTKQKVTEVITDIMNSETTQKITAKAKEMKEKVSEKLNESEAIKNASAKAGEVFEKTKEKSGVVFETCKKRSGEMYVKYYDATMQKKVNKFSTNAQGVMVEGFNKSCVYAKIGFFQSKKMLKQYSVQYAKYSSESLEVSEKEVEPEAQNSEKQSRKQRRSAPKEDTTMETVMKAVQKLTKQAKVNFFYASNVVAMKLSENIEDVSEDQITVVVEDDVEKKNEETFMNKMLNVVNDAVEVAKELGGKITRKEETVVEEERKEETTTAEEEKKETQE